LARVGQAFRAFFGILSGQLPADIAQSFGWVRRDAVKSAPAAPPPPAHKPADGALQILGILQRDARLVDFLMEDLNGFEDEQVGAAVRGVQEQAKTSLARYVKLAPVIDGVEGVYTKVEAAGPLAKDGAAIKFVGNVPANGKAPGGLLRHKGWHAQSVDLPKLSSGQNPAVVAAAEIEIE